MNSEEQLLLDLRRTQDLFESLRLCFYEINDDDRRDQEPLRSEDLIMSFSLVLLHLLDLQPPLKKTCRNTSRDSQDEKRETRQKQKEGGVRNNSRGVNGGEKEGGMRNNSR